MATAKTLYKTFQQATIILLLLVLLHHASAQTSSEHHNFHRQLNRSTTIVMVIIVGVFFILGCLCVYIRQCTRPATTTTRSFARMAIPQGLNHDVLNAFPSFQYSRVKNHKIGKRSLECAVCLCEFEDHDILRLLPKCNHVFHSDCVDTWLESHTTCPVCRADLVLIPGETFSSLSFDSDELETTKVRSIAEMSSSSRGISHGSSPISWSAKLQIGRFFPRSHSTGHSFVQHGGDVDRFTLILPEHVRAELINTTLKRTKSCQFDLPLMRSHKSGYKSEGSNRRGKGYSLYERFNQHGRLDRWEFSTTPPFVRKCISTSLRGSEDRERATTSRKSLTKSVTMPVSCLFPERRNNTDRSFVQLKFNSQV